MEAKRNRGIAQNLWHRALNVFICLSSINYSIVPLIWTTRERFKCVARKNKHLVDIQGLFRLSFRNEEIIKEKDHFASSFFVCHWPSEVYFFNEISVSLFNFI